MTLVLQWRQPDPPIVLRWRGPTDEMVAAVAANPMVTLAAIVGPPGSGGGGGGSGPNWVDGELPMGVKDGSNRLFALAHAPIWLMLVWNGMVQTEGVDFTRIGAAITFLRDGPATDDILAASYSWEQA